MVGLAVGLCRVCLLLLLGGLSAEAVGFSYQPVFGSPHGKPVVATLRDNLYLLTGGPSCQGYLRRSTDSGRSFSTTNCVYSNSWANANDCGGARDTPVAVGNERTGALFFFVQCFAGNLSQVLTNSSYRLDRYKLNMWVAKSTDFGETFSAPHNITQAPPVPAGRNWTVTGVYFADSAGIQTHSGRLLVPGFVDVCFNDPRGTCNKSEAVVYKPNGGRGGFTPYNWAEMTYMLASDDGGSSWHMTSIFGMYSGEAAVVQLFDPPSRLGVSLRIGGPMAPSCPGGAAICDTGYGRGSTMACGIPSVAGRPAPHHCRGWMVSDDDGDSFYNPHERGSLFAAPAPDLPDPGCKGDVARWEAEKALVAVNAQDNLDPGMNQLPRFNLTVSISRDDGRTWPRSLVVFPSTLGPTGYATVRMTADGQIAVHFDTQQHQRCRTQIRNITCAAASRVSMQRCITCSIAHKAELTRQLPGNNTSFCPGKWGWADFGPNDGGLSGVQPNPDAFVAAVTSACGPLTNRDSPDGTLLLLVNPSDMGLSTSAKQEMSSGPNATATSLQRRLDAAADVTIGPQPGDEPNWLVGRPLKLLRSHQRITFSPGTVVWAANNSFHGDTDSLFTIGAYPARLAPDVPAPPSLTNLTIIGYGATWRMRRKDYAKTASGRSNGWYSVSEARMGVKIEGSSGVTLEGITIQETGGDGIYVNTVWNVTVRRVLIDGAYRNGISVIAASGLLVEHSIIQNTRGTDPEAGLDIEPNPCNPATCKHVNFVAGIVFSNVSFQDNFGGGIHVSLGENLGNATMPIGVHIDNCHINGTGFTGPLLATQTALGLGLGVGGAEPNAVTVTGAKIGSPFVNSGEIRFTNLSVANASGGVGLIIESVPADGWAEVIVDGLHMEDVGFNARSKMWAPINILGSYDRGPPSQPGGAAVPTGRIKILNAIVRDRSARPYLRIVDPFGFRGVEFSGTVENPYGCAVDAEAGFPLRDVRLAQIPSTNLSIEVVCNATLVREE